ncbi:MAG: membrane protein insertase YidC [Pseudomonadota bacterium]|uniref:Membrane protein insertase YidC n=1 Tax=Candidatus Desulfatibia profunda TaxID=2841695 RepID=A0A8J6NX42_9BACT|nr:membrane protein insertase YidC [Candidatus Desulfatibia profunda]MBL7179997.1 membrane protein insertase YidC [Desulfobacterales bacterium]
MDNARLIIAVGLSILIFIVWDYFFVGKKKVQQPKQQSQVGQQVEKAPQAPRKEQAAITVAPAQAAIQPQSARPPRVITVNTPLYTVKISEKGAEFKNVILKKYKQSITPGSPLYEMISPDTREGTVRLGFDRNSFAGLEQAVFLTDLEPDAVDILEKPRDVSFLWKSPQGFMIKKTFIFAPETYLIGLSVTLANGSDQTFKDSMFVSLLQPVAPKGSQLGFEGPSALINNAVEQVKAKKIKDQNVYPGKLKWLAIQDRYFISAIIPDKPDEASMRLFLKENDMLENQYLQPESVINPGSQLVFKYNLFFGPKSLSVLKKIGYDLNKAVNFGWFDLLAKPLVWIMNFLYDHFIPNYGVAIIILTIITKIILWPLGTKSYKSMSEMKKIQPLMAGIREKYGKDKKKINEEMMALYRTYKVNPLGGCLPMVVQIPVFFALYRMLYEAIELRHAPFIGWINDLSAPDRLFRFGFSIPFMQPPYGIPVLTIIMGITMLVQQKMSPPPGDPAQAKMMMLMPVVFTAIFINFSSGLVLYWLVNNILSIAQQYYVSKKAA